MDNFGSLKHGSRQQTDSHQTKNHVDCIFGTSQDNNQPLQQTVRGSVAGWPTPWILNPVAKVRFFNGQTFFSENDLWSQYMYMYCLSCLRLRLKAGGNTQIKHNSSRITKTTSVATPNGRRRRTSLYLRPVTS